MSNLRDGLGAEEVNQSGASTVYITGISGTITNLSGTQFQATSVYGTTVSGTGIVGTTISGNTIREGSKGLLHSIAVGSGTATYGAKLEAGSWELGAGSSTWVVFPSAFTNTPIVTVTDMTTADKALLVAAGSLNAGSAYVEGPTASDEFSWIAVGI